MKMDYSLTIAIITIISATAITYFTFKKDRADKIESEGKDKEYRENLQMARDTIVDLQKEAEKQAAVYYNNINTRQNELINKQSEVISLQKDVQSKSEEINKLQEHTINVLTGGDSFCRMDILNIDASNNTGRVAFFILGKFPLSQLQARIVDVNALTDHMTFEDLNNNILDLGFAQPGALVTTQVLRLDKIKGMYINIFYTASNGSFEQSFKMKFINGKWLSYSIVHRGDKVIYEKADKDYPL